MDKCIYDIIFDGKSCKNIFGRMYKSDLHAILAAYKALQAQPYPPEHGKDIATSAEVVSKGERVAFVEMDGSVSI